MESKFRGPMIDDGIDEGFERGVQMGMADMLVFLLGERFTVPAEIRDRVENCASVERLKQWGRRVLTAQSLDDVFAEA